MKRNSTVHQIASAKLAGISRRNLLVRFITLVAAPLILGTAALEFAAVGQSLGAKLKPGDIVYADSGNAIDGGFIIKVDPATGQKTVISSGGYLQMPFDPVIDAD